VKPAEESGSQEEEEEAGGSAIAASDAVDDSKSLPTKNHDEEGEGEEDEETTHTTKSKVFKLQKKEDGTQEWKDLGVGMLRLKKHKTSESRRVLMRNSGTGKITINFNIYAGLNPSLATKFITLIGHDEEGTSATYRLRTQSDQHAQDLKDALNREIAFVKGKAD
jgi:nucleoporin NUP2